MKRRAIAILGLSLLARTPVAAQTAPVIDGQNGTVTISAQTLAWFRQRLAEEEERLRQLQITVQQIARALPNSTGTAPSLSAAPATAVPSPALAAPVTKSPSSAAVPKPSAPTAKPSPRIAVPMWAPAAPTFPPAAVPPTGPDVNGSPVPIAPGADDAAPLGEIEIPPAPDGAQASVTTEPAVVPLAVPLRPGLSLEEVRRIKGTPALISRNEQASTETWSYPDGTIDFQGGRLTTWKLRSGPPAPEPVARRAPRATPAEERRAVPRIALSGATDTDTIPETAAPPPPAAKIAPEKASIEKVAPSRTTARTTTKRVRRAHSRSRRWVSRHRRHHRWVWTHHRHRRYAWSHRRHHRWAKGAVRPVGRHASASTHCRICQMARAHLRSGHRGVVMTEVAGWRSRSKSAGAAKIRPPQRPSMLHQRR